VDLCGFRKKARLVFAFAERTPSLRVPLSIQARAKKQTLAFSACEYSNLDLHNNQFEARASHELVDARQHPRFKLETDICVYPRNSAVVRGYTVDLSESGVSAMLRIEVPLGEVVRLKFNPSTGDVEVMALVRQRQAFRYGFQFVESASARDLIGRTCRELAAKQSEHNP
jgi:hypothetical protein